MDADTAFRLDHLNWGRTVRTQGGQLLGPLAGGGAVLSLIGAVIAAPNVMAAAATGSQGPDFAGIAALVASIAGLVSAVGALLIAWRKPSEPRVIVLREGDDTAIPAQQRKRRAR